jgi:hypothetical protein
MSLLMSLLVRGAQAFPRPTLVAGGEIGLSLLELRAPGTDTAHAPAGTAVCSMGRRSVCFSVKMLVALVPGYAVFLHVRVFVALCGRTGTTLWHSTDKPCLVGPHDAEVARAVTHLAPSMRTEAVAALNTDTVQVPWYPGTPCRTSI